MTLSAQEAWDAVCHGEPQLRFHPAGHILGIDQIGVLRIAELLGYDVEELVKYLPPIEAGLLDGIALLKGQGHAGE